MNQSLEKDMMDCQWFKDKLRTSDVYAQNVYAALCNMQWQPLKVMPILTDELWTCSWRAAGGIIANLRGKDENYMDFYCSGVRGGINYDDEVQSGFVSEGEVTDEVRTDFASLGWHPVPYVKE